MTDIDLLPLICGTREMKILIATTYSGDILSIRYFSRLTMNRMYYLSTLNLKHLICPIKKDNHW